MRQKLKDYLRHPGSFIVFLLIMIASIITVGVMVFLVAYILIKGIPNITPELFAWEYTSKNVSMMPAIINIFSGIPCGVREKRF